jgi:outer membrane protein TolC
MESTRESERLAGQLLETEQKRLEQGLARTFDVLRARAALAEARTRRLAAHAEYNQAATNLHLVAGTLLERHGIRIDRGGPQPKLVKAAK